MIAAIRREYGVTVNVSPIARVRTKKRTDVVSPDSVENVRDAAAVLPHLS